MPKCVRVTPEEWDRRAEAVGIEWLTRPANATALTPARCRLCGYEWNARPRTIAAGHGCPPCGGTRLRAGEWESRADDVGIEWLEPVRNGRTPTKARCLTCGREWAMRPAQTERGQGCSECAGRRVPDGEWGRRAAAVGIEWLEPVGRSPQGGHDACCLTCGLTFRPWPHAVARGSGCPECGRERTRRALGLGQEEWDRRIAAVGAEWVEPVLGNAPTAARCLTCRREWAAWPSGITAGSGCPACGQVRAREVLRERRVPQSVWDERITLVGARWLEPVSDSHTATRAQCDTCGHEWQPWPTVVYSGSGCPVCAEPGLDPSGPGRVYLVTLPDMGIVKVGVMNTGRRRDRLATHRARGWEVVQWWDVPTGADAVKVERAVLAAWRERGAMPCSRDDVPAGDGYTEAVWVGRVDIPDTLAFIDSVVG